VKEVKFLIRHKSLYVLVFLFLVPMVVGEQMPITAHNFVQIVAKEKRGVLIQIPQKTTVRVSIAEKMSIIGKKDIEKQEFIKDPSKKIGDLIKAVIAKTGENIRLGKIIRVELNYLLY